MRWQLTQAEPVGLVCKDHPEPAGLLALEGLAEGKQHLAVQEAAPKHHLLLPGALAKVLGGGRREA